MRRKKFEIDVWLEEGEKLLDIGKDVAKEYLEHHEAINSIGKMLIKLALASRNNDNLKAEKINDELNFLSEGVDKDVWRIWTTRIRAKRNSEGKYSFRIARSQLEYLNSCAGENEVELKGLIDNISYEYFLVDKVDKEFLDSFSKLSALDKRICKALFIELFQALTTGKVPDFAKEVHKVRGFNTNAEDRYAFKYHKKNMTDFKGGSVGKVKEGLNDELQYVVSPLSKRVWRHLILLSKRHSKIS